jgi:hypothetical protein
MQMPDELCRGRARMNLDRQRRLFDACMDVAKDEECERLLSYLGLPFNT